MTRDCDFCLGAGAILHGRFTLPCPVCRPQRRRPEPVLAEPIELFLWGYEDAALWLEKG